MKERVKNERVFRFIAVLLPFFLLFFIEILLRLFNVGYDLSLFINYPEDEDFLILNPNVSLRYFSEEENATRGFIEPFRNEKKEGTLRFFVLGGSTAYGFPYENNGSFHRMLQYKLNQSYPEKNIEIINLSLTAINSYTLLDFSKELAEQNPDGILIYAGHNEYYGALGVGSTSNAELPGGLKKVSIGFKKLRLGQQLMKLSGLLSKKDKIDLSTTLMERMVASGKEIKKDSHLYNLGLEQFNDNMSELLSVFQDQKIPVFIGTLVSNLKDQKPFISDSIIINNADFYYDKGKGFLLANNFDSAQVCFVKAKDEDMLRFRAPEEINKSIEILAEQYGAILVPVKNCFVEHSEGGIIGSELILEHLHPNLYGYYLIAESFYFSLLNYYSFAIQEDCQRKFDFNKLPITEMDSLLGAYTNLILRSQWPFNEVMPEIDVTGKTMPEILAGGLAVKSIDWNTAMEKLYQYYLEKQDYIGMLKVMESLALAYPKNNDFCLKSGQFAENIKDYKKAFTYFKASFELQPGMTNLVYCVKTGVQSENYKALLSILNSENVGQLDERLIKKMKEDLLLIEILEQQVNEKHGNVELYESLSKLYYNFGLYSKTKYYVDELLKIEPGNKVATILRSKLKE